MPEQDTFRRNPKQINAAVETNIGIIKQQAEVLERYIRRSEPSDPAMITLSIRKLEEAVMWATKAIT